MLGCRGRLYKPLPRVLDTTPRILRQFSFSAQIPKWSMYKIVVTMFRHLGCHRHGVDQLIRPTLR